MTKTRQPLDLWVAFLRAHSAAVEAIGSDLRRRHGIGLTEFEVLLRLSQGPDHGMRMQDLAEHALLSKSGGTRLIDRMEREGLVARRACPTDRRGTYVVLTSKGRRTLHAADPAARAAVDRHFSSNVEPAESAAMLAALERIASAHGTGGVDCQATD